MRILAIDPGTHCGWASWDGERIDSGVWDLTPRHDETPGARYMLMEMYLRLHGDHVRPAVVAWEESHQQGRALAIYNGLLAVMQKFVSECATHRQVIEVRMVHNSTLKKWATGNGRASKQEMVVAASEWLFCHNPPGVTYMPPADDNEADALLVLAWAMEQTGTEKEKGND